MDSKYKVIMTVLCYIEKDGKYLMLHRVKKQFDKSKDKWLGIGGKIEMYETPYEAVIREALEETGYTIKNPTLRGICVFPNFNEKEATDFMFVYTTNEFEGTQIECDEGDLVWVDKSEVKNLNIWQGDKLIFDWINDNKFFTGKFFYEDDEFKDYTVEFNKGR